MKTKIYINLVLTGLILIIFTVDLSAQMNFKDLVRYSVLTYGAAGEWDDGVVWNPAVIKDGDTLRMWYGGSHGSVWEPDWSHIGYAWSLDGIEWNKYGGNPVLSATLYWEGGWVGNPVVIKDGDTLKMWYDAENKGYAESYDGINWTKHPEPLALTESPQSEWDHAFLWMKTVIKEGNEYKLWYSGGRPGFPMENSYPQVGFATSYDGINWIKYDDPTTQNAPYAYSDPVIKVGEDNDWDSHRAFEPWVMKTDTGYLMFYTGVKGPINTSVKQQIGLAYSTDGIHWIKDEQNPIIKDDHSVVNWGRGFYNGSALFYDNRFHFWFSCFTTPPYQARPQIGYAVQLKSCLPEGIEFTTQAEIDSFQVNCNNCNVIEGDLTIQGEDITNLNGLVNLTSIEGYLAIIRNDLLTNLSGLENLNSVNGSLMIGGWFPYVNPSLQSLTGLNNLSNVGDYIEISSNPMLENLIGLESLTSVGGSLRIGNSNAKSKNDDIKMNRNASLKDLTGLENLKTIQGPLILQSNDSLTSLKGLENLDSIGGFNIAGQISNLSGLNNLSYIGEYGISISGTALISLNGLEKAKLTGGDLRILFNDSLSMCDVKSICNFLSNPNGEIEIGYNSLGCNSQEEVEEDCDNNCLPDGFSPYLQEDIDNFPSKYLGCSEIEGNVFISSSLITNLDSLYAITTIGGNLSISGCKNLQGLSGLDNITNIAGNLTIRDNENLSMCNADGICNYLTNPNGEINIENNADGCESTNQVLDSCGIDAVNEHAFANKTTLNPNPFTTSTTIKYQLNTPQTVSITFYNQIGKQVDVIQQKQAQGKQHVTWNAESQPAGIYYFRLEAGDQVASGKVVLVK